MKATWIKILIGFLITGVVVTTVIVGTNMYPDLTKMVTDKINSIITGKAPLGNITVVRDLKGTWTSSLKGKGIQLYGKFNVTPGKSVVYETGDVKLIIKSVSNNVATGTIEYTNLCVWGTTTIPGLPTISVPRQCTASTGAKVISIKVSGTKLDFGTVHGSGYNFTMQGSYTTDIISGTMTADISPYGVIKGTFNLSRQK